MSRHPPAGGEQKPVPAGLGDKQGSWGCRGRRWAEPLLCHLKLESQPGWKPGRHCRIASPELHSEALFRVAYRARHAGTPKASPAARWYPSRTSLAPSLLSPPARYVVPIFLSALGTTPRCSGSVGVVSL